MIVQIRGLLFSGIDWAEPKGRFKLQFEVNGQAYFLAFVEEERRWYVFAPNVAGVHRIPVYVDAPSSAKIVLAEEGKPTISN
jgi:hypothetical protein